MTVSCQYARVEPQVMMVSLIREGKDMVFFLLREMGVDRIRFCQAISDSLRNIRHSANAHPPISDNLQHVLERSVTLSVESGASVVALEHLFWSFAETAGPVKDIMTELGITGTRVRDAVAAFRNGNKIGRAHV